MASHDRGVLDTSVIIDLAAIAADKLPIMASVTAVTLAELAAGPLAAATTAEAAVRLARLQWVEGTFEALPFDVSAARAYGRVYAAAITAKQKPRGGRAVDLLIAATALARGLPLYTRNYADYASVAHLLDIVAV